MKNNNVLGSIARPVHRAYNLIAICEPIVLTVGSSTSHNPIGVHGLLWVYLYFFTFMTYMHSLDLFSLGGLCKIHCALFWEWPGPVSHCNYMWLNCEGQVQFQGITWKMCSSHKVFVKCFWPLSLVRSWLGNVLHKICNLVVWRFTWKWPVTLKMEAVCSEMLVPMYQATW
jgi:hypothetical protein